MVRLPVIVGFGGFNAAGRSSHHQAYQRTVLDSLSQAKQDETLTGLAVMMGKASYQSGAYIDNQQGIFNALKHKENICADTLIRPISEAYFDVHRVAATYNVSLAGTTQQTLQFNLLKRRLPHPLPPEWQLIELDAKTVQVTIAPEANVRLQTHYRSNVQSAGQLPAGFEPSSLYRSRFHPRGLQLSIIGASDALNHMGVDWQLIKNKVSPDQIAAYSSSVMSQLDPNGIGGLLQARLQGDRVTTKQLALGLGSMSADFVNAYVLGNLGATASISGACAGFLYNLRAAVQDIQAGRCRVAVVGSSEAPITPEIIDGFATMGALATVEKLACLPGGHDLRRASRPFGDNCGFVIAESTQHVVLMDDALAMELGADIHGAVTDVFVNADGYKKSISAPGPGNYLTMAKAVAAARAIVGEKSIKQHSFVQAHGSSTPQNRVTESMLLSRVAGAFGIESWPMTAVKAFVGHSLGPASGDQLINTLGIFNQQLLPGIKTIEGVADDVVQDHLSFACRDMTLDNPEVSFLNSKGFGGNNASACVLSPTVVERMLTKRYGVQSMKNYQQALEVTQENSQQYHQQCLQGKFSTIYQFGESMLDDGSIVIDDRSLSVPEYGLSIDLAMENLYKDMTS